MVVSPTASTGFAIATDDIENVQPGTSFSFFGDEVRLDATQELVEAAGRDAL